MSIISISELRRNCFSIIAKLQKTKRPILISKKGKTVAKLIPSPSSDEGNKSWLGCMIGTGRIVGNIVTPVHEHSDWEVLQK